MSTVDGSTARARSLASPVAISLGALLIYLFLPTKNYYWDGVYFALNIEKALRLEAYLFHPNHLLYEVAGYWLYSAANYAGFHLRAIQALQIANSILSALSILVVYAILLTTTHSRYIASTLSILFAFSSTWWKFSTDADSYIPTILMMLIAFLLVIRPTKARPLAVALSHSAAMVFHQLAVFLYPVLLLGLALQTSSSTRAKRRWVLVQYTVGASLLTLSAYWYGYATGEGHHDLRHFLRWLTSASPDAHFTFNPWGNLVTALRSQVQLLLGGRATSMMRFVNPLIAFLVLLLLTLSIALAVRIARHRDELRSLFRAALTSQGELSGLWKLTVLWIATYWLFLYFWLAHNSFYRLFYLPPLVFFLGVALARYKASGGVRRWRTALLACCVVLSNFVFSIYPHAHVADNPVLSFALQMNKIWPPGTEVYYGSFNTDDSCFSYFNPQTVWKPIAVDSLDNLDHGLVSIYGQGRTAWVDVTGAELLSSSPVGGDWLKAHFRNGSLHEFVQGGYHMRFIQLLPANIAGPASSRTLGE